MYMTVQERIVLDHIFSLNRGQNGAEVPIVLITISFTIVNKTKQIKNTHVEIMIQYINSISYFSTIISSCFFEVDLII